MHGTAPGERWLSGGFFCARVRTAGALRSAGSRLQFFANKKNRPEGGTAEGGEMIRACACGAKLFAALGYEQPGRLRPAGPPFQFSANKKNRLKGRTAEGGEMIRACACGAKLASRVRTAGALTPRRFASSVLRQQKKPPERRLFLLVEMIRLELTTYTLRTYRSTG